MNDNNLMKGMKMNEVIKTTAVINSITVGCHADKVSFTALSLQPEENEVITNIVKTESPVRVCIDLPTPDENFPPVEVEGIMKGYKISKTCDAPDITGIQFSSGQVEQITNYIRSEQEIALTFTQIQKQLEFEEDGPDAEPEPEE